MMIAVGSSAAPDGGSGISTYAKELSEGLIAKGIDVAYVSPTPKSKLWLERQGIVHLPTDPNEDQVNVARNIVRQLSKMEVAAVLNNDNSIIQSILPLLDCPAIAIGHLDAYAIVKMAVFNKQWCDYIVTISNDMQKNYVLNHGVDIAACPVVHNGIQAPENFAPRTLNDNALQVICVTEYSRRKGGDHILSLCRKVPDSIPNVKLDWFGDVPKSIARKAECYNSIKVRGRVPRQDLLQAIKAADIFIMASRMEGCPMSMLEAMSYGVLPVVSDGVGAMRWLVNSGIEGFVCSLKDWANQAAQCIAELDNDRPRLLEMQNKTRERFIKEYQIDRVVDDLLSLIQKPRIERDAKKPNFVDVAAWHRHNPEVNPATFLQRLDWRLGRIRKAGRLNVL